MAERNVTRFWLLGHSKGEEGVDQFGNFEDSSEEVQSSSFWS